MAVPFGSTKRAGCLDCQRQMVDVRPKQKFPNKPFETFSFLNEDDQVNQDFSATGYNHHSVDIFGVQGFF